LAGRSDFSHLTGENSNLAVDHDFKSRDYSDQYFGQTTDASATQPLLANQATLNPKCRQRERC
jgi:hypothetical protein